MLNKMAKYNLQQLASLINERRTVADDISAALSNVDSTERLKVIRQVYKNTDYFQQVSEAIRNGEKPREKLK